MGRIIYLVWIIKLIPRFSAVIVVQSKRSSSRKQVNEYEKIIRSRIVRAKVFMQWNMRRKKCRKNNKKSDQWKSRLQDANVGAAVSAEGRNPRMTARTNERTGNSCRREWRSETRTMDLGRDQNKRRVFLYYLCKYQNKTRSWVRQSSLFIYDISNLFYLFRESSLFI